MNETRRSLLFFYTETPLHAGSGTGLGAIDLPLQRERMSDLPQVQGSGIKGALRELFRAPGDERTDQRNLEEALFGPRPPDPDKDRVKRKAASSEPDPQAQEHAGALASTDARLLLLPLRTAHGGWAWVISPLILQRFARDLGFTQGSGKLPAWAALAPTPDQAMVAKSDIPIASKGKLVIEDALYNIVEKGPEIAELVDVLKQALPVAEVYKPTKDRLPQQLAILSDEEMAYWAKHGTEVVTRIRIDPQTGTVAEGALWTEEALPSESLLWSVLVLSGSRQKSKHPGHASAADLTKAFSKHLDKHPRILLGGDRTVGRGLVALKLQQQETGGSHGETP